MSNRLHNNRRRLNSGYVVIINVLILALISMFISYAIASPLLSASRAADSILSSKQAMLVAGSALDETIYKLKHQLTVMPSESLTLGGVSASVTVASTFEGRTIQVSSAAEDTVRELQVKLAESQGVSFNYGIQAGRGGFEMSGGAGINGNVYSNGNILGSGGPYITGSATVANGADPTLHQTSGGTLPPPNEILFGGQLTSNDKKPEDAAQSFTVSTTTPVTSVRLYMKKYANVWMNDATVRITNNSSGRPGNTTLASATLSANQVTTSFNYLSLPFSSQPTLTPGTTYWIVIDTSNTWHSYYILGAAPNTYNNGIAKTGVYGGSSWNNTSPSGLDAYFDLYVGGQTGRISGVSIGSAGGDAWAHEVSNSNVTGTIYCQAGFNNNKACNTSRTDPVQQPYPVSDGNIDAWKAEAEAGGVQTGNVSVGQWPNQNASLGPRKIVGNLDVNSSGVLTVEGTLWVTGNVTVSGGGVIKLSNSFGGQSGVIVTDGRVTASGGGQFAGNGQTGSYILVITTSTCPAGSCSGNPAIYISGGTGAVILNAQKGTINFSGGAAAKQATAEKIIMSGGTTVNYETGIADMNFSSGPSGSWSITSWSEI